MATVAYRAVRSRQKFIKAPEIKKAMNAFFGAEIKPHFIGKFKEVTANWKHKPIFYGKRTVTANQISLFVHPGGKNKQIYEWVTLGTKGPYPIPKAGPGYLAFQLGYKPKTKSPGKFGGPGTYSGPFVKGVMQVIHPGIEPRDFESVIAEEQKDWYSRTMENAWRRILRAV